MVFMLSVEMIAWPICFQMLIFFDPDLPSLINAKPLQAFDRPTWAFILVARKAQTANIGNIDAIFRQRNLLGDVARKKSLEPPA